MTGAGILLAGEQSTDFPEKMRNLTKLQWSLLLAFTMLLWSTYHPATKYVTNYFASVTDDKLAPPLIINFFRALLPAVLLFFYFSHKKNIFLKREDLFYFALLGFLDMALARTLLIFGVMFSLASASAILVNTNALFVALLAPLFVDEHFAIKKIAGVLVGLFGVFLVVLNFRALSLVIASDYFKGTLFLIAAAIVIAIATILAKRVVKEYGSTQTMYFNQNFFSLKNFVVG